MKIDHIVYAVYDLEEACVDIEFKIGIKPVFGGYHKTQGTKNALFNLGDGCYFEILAIDGKNKKIAPPHWMGIDLIKIPKITRWAIKSENIEEDSIVLKNYNSRMGEIIEAQRETKNGNLLKWRMTKPLAEPEVEVVPFLLNWKNSDHHPTDKLPFHCQLMELKISHPHPDRILPIFQKLGINLSIEKAAKAKLSAIIDSPNGIIEI